MRKFFEIFRLQWRALARSGAFAALLVASVAWMLVLPRIMRGDGTESGEFAMQVRYSLGIVFSLSVVALSASAAGSIATEREARRLQLTMVRPVRLFAVALARVAAITAAGAAVLAIAAAILWFQTGRGRTCDHALSPILESPETAADRMFDDYMKRYPDFREKVGETGEGEMRRYLAQYVRDSYQTVSTNESASWSFDLSGFGGSRDYSVRVRMTDLFGRLKDVAGTFSVNGRAGDLDNVSKTLVAVPLSREVRTDEDRVDVLSFANTGTTSVTIYPRRDLQLLIRADSFAWNLFRAWLELVAVLALVVAVGVFLGASLSRPVAVFVMISLLFVAVVTPSTVENCPDPTTTTAADRVGLAISRFSAAATSPFYAYAPVGALEDGTCVEWSEVGEALATDGVFIPLVLSLLAGLVMSRRESI